MPIPTKAQLETALAEYDVLKPRNPAEPLIAAVAFLREFIRALNRNAVPAEQSIPSVYFTSFVSTLGVNVRQMLNMAYLKVGSPERNLFNKIWNDDLDRSNPFLVECLGFLAKENRLRKFLVLTELAGLGSGSKFTDFIVKLYYLVNCVPPIDRESMLSLLLDKESGRPKLSYMFNSEDEVHRPREPKDRLYELNRWLESALKLLKLFPERGRLSVFSKIFPHQQYLFVIEMAMERIPEDARVTNLNLLVGEQARYSMGFLRVMNRLPVEERAAAALRLSEDAYYSGTIAEFADSFPAAQQVEVIRLMLGPQAHDIGEVYSKILARLPGADSVAQIKKIMSLLRKDLEGDSFLCAHYIIDILDHLPVLDRIAAFNLICSLNDPDHLSDLAAFKDFFASIDYLSVLRELIVFEPHLDSIIKLIDLLDTPALTYKFLLANARHASTMIELLELLHSGDSDALAAYSRRATKTAFSAIQRKITPDNGFQLSLIKEILELIPFKKRLGMVLYFLNSKTNIKFVHRALRLLAGESEEANFAYLISLNKHKTYWVLISAFLENGPAAFRKSDLFDLIKNYVASTAVTSLSILKGSLAQRRVAKLLNAFLRADDLLDLEAFQLSLIAAPVNLEERLALIAELFPAALTVAQVTRLGNALCAMEADDDCKHVLLGALRDNSLLVGSSELIAYDPDSAIQHYAEVSPLSPDYATAQLAAGSLSAFLENYADARRFFAAGASASYSSAAYDARGSYSLFSTRPRMLEPDRPLPKEDDPKAFFVGLRALP